MKKIVILVSLALVLGLVLVGCPQPTDGGETPAPTFEDYTSTTASIGMKAIPSGEFARGDTDITVSNFYLGETEVTQGQWEAVMGTTWPGLDPESDDENYGDGNDYPAYYINWYDAIAFCNKLSFMEGLTPVYSVKVGGVEVDWENITGALTPDVDDTDWNAVTVNSDADGYRLPTEAEWEYAAGWEKNEVRNSHAGVNIITDDDKDGIDDNDGTKDLRDYAWYEENTGASSSDENYGSKDVKTKKPNALGLYDMSGNVREWCYDWYNEVSPLVYRGGSWYNYASSCRVAYRVIGTPRKRYDAVGFRVARSVAP